MLATKGICIARKYYYSMVNKTIMYRKTRWCVTLMLALLYLQRVNGLSYDVITYLIFFYILQLIISYFTPKGLVQDELLDTQEDPFAVQEQQSFIFNQIITQTQKPLVRSMSQVQIWERVSFVFIMGLVCTCFKAFEIDVFWPVLMVYSAVLFCYTIHKIITKMEKYRYGIRDFDKKPIRD